MRYFKIFLITVFIFIVASPIIRVLLGMIKLPPSKSSLNKIFQENEPYIEKAIEYIASINSENVFITYDADINGDRKADIVELNSNGSYVVTSSETILANSDIGQAIEKLYDINFDIVKKNGIIKIDVFQNKYLFLNYSSGYILKQDGAAFEYNKNQNPKAINDKWDFVSEVSPAKVEFTEILDFFFGINIETYFYENPTLSTPVVN